MKINGVLAILLTTFISPTFSQNLTQTVRGTVLDTDSKLPIIGAGVAILDTDPLLGTTTDEKGEFRFTNISVGRITLQLSYIGFEKVSMPNIEVNSGKEVVLTINMQESVLQTEEIVIEANKNKGEALNDMSLVSSRSISLDDSKRYANSYNDPARILANFAGVATSDASNEIIVRGNSPKYMQWRLEGVEITNPNHFNDQNAASGSVSALNNNLLSTSDFSTGAFSPEYGDVLSGVYDVNLRAGNNQKRESTFGMGILGTDLTLEGPFKKGYKGSYLANYRYSTVTLIDKIGLISVGGVPKFQDGAFKIVLPTNKLGTFSLFGLGGLSGVEFKDIKPTIFTTPGGRSMLPDVSEDYKKISFLANVGLNHTFTINEKSFIKSSLSYSGNGISDDIYEYKTFKQYNSQGEYQGDSVTARNENFKGRLVKSTYRGAITFNYKLNARNKIQIGSKYALFGYNYNQSQLFGNATERTTVVDFNENVSTLRNFISWKYRLTDHVTIVTGFHNMNVLLNNKSTLEPRFAINWKLNHTNSFHFGYGKHSNMESIHNYFAKVQQKDGSYTEPNKNLDLLKAHHFVIGYEKRFTDNLMLKLEAYYQHLYSLPVENNDTSYYATINEGTQFRYVELVNKGTGKNYGIEFTLERFFNKNYYFLINGSLYNSKYKSLEGIERNTQYNGNYIVNALCGKEFVKLGRKNNQTLNLNLKVFVGGGKKIIPLLRDNDGNLAVDVANGKFYDYSKAYNNKLEDTYQITLSASYKWNKSKTTHELFLNLENITNTKGKLSEFYDESQPGKIGYVRQFGLFPNLMYRVYF
jgi:hypothetical protein